MIAAASLARLVVASFWLQMEMWGPQVGFDYALLGPVLPTPTHPEAAGIGWDGFSSAICGSPLPVFALGGMKNEMLAGAQAHGAHGIALMRGW